MFDNSNKSKKSDNPFPKKNPWVSKDISHNSRKIARACVQYLCNYIVPSSDER